ncbi:ATP-binding protein [Vallitalea pronyensis]|uniref:histidine kinase n=1 Tax=Vallitalea pronyensis TaxID=1348613 RepID=A0A8J8SGZ2_9FIRM|nr:HAMP domain-containing sensor histidine kinase [Vallitalea pronyensis]QUI22828.1 ATP-binding protein [Vallitalea pronyensis]
MRNNVLIRGIIRLLSLPFGLFRGINRHFLKLRTSIKRKITFNFVLLYIVTGIFTIIIVLSGYYYLEYEVFMPSEVHNDIQLIKTCSTDAEFNDILSKIGYYRNADIFITELNNDIVYMDNKYNDFLGFPFTMVEFFEFIPTYRKIPYISMLFINNHQYKIYYYFNLYDYLEKGYLLLLIVGGAELFGLMVIWIFGSLKSKKVLKPIYTMTKTAKEISIYNLDARLNISEAKYELKDMAYTLNKMLDNLKIDYTKQKRFVSDVSHELRTPISIIDGYASMLQRWGKKDEAILDESIEAIKNEANNMKDLVENLLFLARHDNQTLKYNRENFYIDELLNEVIKETAIIDKKHILEHNISPNLVIYGDRNRIKQAIRIFVDNAIKYTPPSGKIVIKCFKDNDNIVISIKDTGIGISREDLGNIFNRFYRSDKSRTRETGGHGLGLSIAKIIIVGHQGKIKVRSKLEVGSEIIIHFPPIPVKLK